jgi:hypothetical protein
LCPPAHCNWLHSVTITSMAAACTASWCHAPAAATGIGFGAARVILCGQQFSLGAAALVCMHASGPAKCSPHLLHRRCYEVACVPGAFSDGYGNSLNRHGACKGEGSTVIVRVTDTCPCVYPGNAYSNKRWCCGDMRHMDMSKWAYEKVSPLCLIVHSCSAAGQRRQLLLLVCSR